MYYDVCRKVLLLDRTIKAMKLKLCLVQFDTGNWERYLCVLNLNVYWLLMLVAFFFCNIVTITTWILQQVFSISLIFYNFRNFLGIFGKPQGGRPTWSENFTTTGAGTFTTLRRWVTARRGFIAQGPCRGKA